MNNKKRKVKEKIILLTTILLVIPLVLAQNDPGHDTLYIEEQGDSDLNGSLNITQNLTVNGGEIKQPGGLTLFGDDSTPASGPPYISGTSGNNLYLDAQGNVYIKWNMGGGTVYIGSGPSTVTDLNVSGNTTIQGALYFGADEILYTSAAGGASSSDLYWGDKLLCNASQTNCGWAANATGGGDITSVQDGDKWLDGGADTGAVTLTFNETELNDTIDARDSTGTDDQNLSEVLTEGDTSSANQDLTIYDGGICADNAGNCGGTLIDGYIYADTFYDNDGFVVDGDITGITTTDGSSGLDGGCTDGTCSLNVNVTDIIDTSYGLTENSNNIRIDLEPSHGLEFIGGDLGVINDCGDTEILKWNNTATAWECENDENAGGAMSSWILDGDTGSQQMIYDGDDVNITGGTDGIDTVVGGVDRITINFDATELPNDDINESKISFATSCDSGYHLYISGNNLACEADSAGTDDQNLSEVLSQGDTSSANQDLTIYDGGICADNAGNCGGTLTDGTIYADNFVCNGGDCIGDTELTYNTGQHLNTTSTPNFNDLTLNDDLFVNDFGRIDALRVGTTSTDPGDGNIYVENYAQILGGVHIGGTSDPGDDNLIVDGNIQAVGDINTTTGDICIEGGTCLSAAGGGDMTNWILDADTGTTQTIDDGETVNITGSNTIDTTVGATNQITIDVQTNSIGDTELTYNTGQHLNTTSTPNFNDLTLNDDLFVNDFGRIDALRVGTTSTDPGDGNIYVENYAQILGGVHIGGTSDPGDDNLIVDGNIDVDGSTHDMEGTLTVDDIQCEASGCINAAELNSDVAGTGLDSTTGVLSVDVTDIINTSYGLTETSNKIQIDLEPNHGLEFIGGDLGVINDCGDTQILKWNNTATAWECENDDDSGGTGDITAVYTNDKWLDGGADTGDVTLTFNESEMNTTIDARDDMCNESGNCAQLFIGSNELDDASGSAAGADLYYGNDLACDVSEASCGWIDGITTTDGSSGLDGGCTAGACDVSVDVTDIIDTSTGGLTESSNNIQVNAGDGIDVSTDVDVDVTDIIAANQGIVEIATNNIGLSQSCVDTEILKWNNTASAWECEDDENAGGAMSSWTIAGDSGSTAVSDGQTVTIAGSGTIDTSESSRTVTVSVQSDSIGDTQLTYNTGQHLTTTSNVQFGSVDLNSESNVDDDKAILDTGYIEFINKENDDILAQDGVMYWDASEGWMGYDGADYRTFITNYESDTEDLTVRLQTLKTTDLEDEDASNFFDGSCTYGVASIDSTGTLSCAAQQGTGDGTVTSVAAGDGMDFTTITTSGSVTMGTPGTLTSATSNAVTTTSHTHAITNYALSGTTNQITVTGAGKVLGAATTLSLPQNIHAAATPTFGGLTINGDVDMTDDDLENVGTVYHDDTTRYLSRVTSDGTDSGTLHEIGSYWDTGTNYLRYRGYSGVALDVQTTNVLTSTTSAMTIVPDLTVSGDLTISGNDLKDSGGDTFFENSCGDNQHITGISTTGAISCADDSGDIAGITTTATTSGLDGGCTDGTCTLLVDASDLTDTTNDGITTSGENFVVTGGTCLTADANGLNVDSGCVNAATIDGFDSTEILLESTPLGASEDLDTFTTTGLYHQNSNADAGTGSNYPVALAGSLQVVSDEGFYYQKYHTYGGNNDVWTRTYYSASWDGWERQYSDGNDPLDTIAEWQSLCTDCVQTGDIGDILDASHITDIYVLIAGDTMNGALSIGQTTGEGLTIGDTNCDAGGCNVEIEDGSLCVGSAGCTASATEGTLTVEANIGVEGNIYDISQTTLTVNDDLAVAGGDIDLTADGACGSGISMCRSSGDTMIRSSGGGDVIIKLG